MLGSGIILCRLHLTAIGRSEGTQPSANLVASHLSNLSSAIAYITLHIPTSTSLPKTYVSLSATRYWQRKDIHKDHCCKPFTLGALLLDILICKSTYSLEMVQKNPSGSNLEPFNLPRFNCCTTWAQRSGLAICVCVSSRHVKQLVVSPTFLHPPNQTRQQPLVWAISAGWT